MKRILMTLATVTTVATVACGGSDTDLETAFCDGLEAQAARTVSAAPTANDAADVTDVARVDVELVESDGDYSGFVTYLPDEAGSFAFGLTEDVPFIVRDASGAEIPLDVSIAGASQCSALAIRHTVTLDLQPYTIEIGPTPLATIGLIAEESDDDLAAAAE